MAWVPVDIVLDGRTVAASKHHSGVFSVPFGLAVTVGDIFTCDGMLFETLSVTDLNNRGEVYILQVKEVEDEQQEAWGTDDQDGIDGIEWEGDA